jgi:uncharacterized protein YgiM (DUF1202 family)
MKTNVCLASLTLWALALTAGRLDAGEAAVVKRDSVNVRGLPSFTGEVVTQLKQGETVTVLEEITAKDAKPDVPAKWAKIALPTGTPVWVSAQFIDVTTKTVTARRLNLRAGPGENYSILGRVEKGAALKEISTRGDWMEIEAPENAYGFVACELLEMKPAAPPVAAPPPAPSNPEPPVTAPPPPPPVPTQEPKPEVKSEAPPEPKPEAPPETAVTPPPPSTPLPNPAPAVSPAPDVALPEAPPVPTLPRVVRREGIVAGTVSIQAPTYFELDNVYSGRVMNYLHTTSTNINLKTLSGKRVVVTGEEAVDARWPKTPVLEIETIDTVP